MAKVGVLNEGKVVMKVGGQNAEVLDDLVPGSSTGNGVGGVGADFSLGISFCLSTLVRFSCFRLFTLSKLFTAWLYGGRRVCGVAEK